MSNKENYAATSIRIHPAHLETIKAEAQRQGVKTSTLIRHAIEIYCQHIQRHPLETYEQVAQDLNHTMQAAETDQETEEEK